MELARHYFVNVGHYPFTMVSPPLQKPVAAFHSKLEETMQSTVKERAAVEKRSLNPK